MRLSGAVRLLILLYTLVLFAVVVVSGRSGRYERYFALIILAGQVPFPFVTTLLEGAPELLLTVAIDLSGVMGVAWLLARRSALWLKIELAIQIMGLPLNLLLYGLHTPGEGPDPAWTRLYIGAGVLAYLQLTVLVCAVLRREFGPPYPVPTPSRGDVRSPHADRDR